MKDFIVIFALVSDILFFSLCAIVGYEYEGADTSPIYTLFIVLSNLGASSIIVWDILQKKVKLKKKIKQFCVLIPAIFVILYLVERIISSELSEQMTKDLSYMGIFSLPCLLAGYYIAAKGISRYTRWVEIIMLVITVAIVRTLMTLTTGLAVLGHVGMGGATYQAFSYYSAFAFCICLCFVLYGDRLYRFSFFKKPFIKYVYSVCLAIQLLGCLISGGRGGIILIFLFSVFLLIKAKKGSLILKTAICCLALLFVAPKFLSRYGLDDFFDASLERVFSYVSSDGIDLSQTSNRDEKYSIAFTHIQNHSYLGGGIFTSNAEIGYPHNMFIEFLQQGGILYLVFWCIVLYSLFYKGIIKQKNYGEFILFPFIFYPLVYLQFSGSYLTTGLFWFMLAYLSYAIMMRKNKSTHNNKKISLSIIKGNRGL